MAHILAGGGYMRVFQLKFSTKYFDDLEIIITVAMLHWNLAGIFARIIELVFFLFMGGGGGEPVPPPVSYAYAQCPFLPHKVDGTNTTIVCYCSKYSHKVALASTCTHTFVHVYIH